MDDSVFKPIPAEYYSDPAEAPMQSPPQSGPEINFLDPDALIAFVDRHRTQSREKAGYAEHIDQRIRAAGFACRRLAQLPDDWRSLIDEFSRDFPNFGALTDLLHNHFALHAMGDARVSWPPILLVGPPGIGKTEAVRWWSERLGLPFRVVDMSSAQTGVMLSGTEQYWRNSEPGVLFKLLAFQSLANPILLLDEIDKGAESRINGPDPLSALYTLLEPRSARTFTDLWITDFSVDASHVNWIATANSAQSIPAPILSRMTLLRIDKPTPDQVSRIARNIYGRLRADAPWGKSFDAYLSDDVVRRLQTLPPRALIQVLLRAFGRAARASRTYVTPDDLPREWNSGRRKIGFTD